MGRLIDETVQNIEFLRAVKGGEYAGDDDALANFREAARDLGVLPEQVWMVYYHKHWTSVRQYIKDLATGRERPRSEPIDGRIDDMIVYLLLQKAMIRERKRNAVGREG